MRDLHINAKELCALVLAAASFGDAWRGLRVKFLCDNATTVAALSAIRSSSEEMAELIRSLHFIAASHDFTFDVAHVPGLTNTIADALSRNQLAEFERLVPAESRDPSPTRVRAEAIRTF